MLICDCLGQRNIKKYNEQGNKVGDIACSNKPYYLTLTHSDKIAVTYLSESYIEIINLKKTHVKRITLQDSCRGISYQDSKLYVVVDHIGIVVLDLSGEIINTLAKNNSPIQNVTTSKDRIYFILHKTDTMHCLSLTGEEIWTFKDKAVMHLDGLAVIINQDVIVAGNSTHNLAIINQNGLESKILLTETDGLLGPRAISYNEDRNEVLVCNHRNKKAAVYKVIVG